jgi:hypothetical protein
MRDAYKEATEIGRKNGSRDLYYPASSRLVAEVALNGPHMGKRRAARNEKGGDADFWTVVGDIELRQYEAFSAGQLTSAKCQQLEREYRSLHKRVRAPRKWASVYDTAFLVLGSEAKRVPAAHPKSASALLKLLRHLTHSEDSEQPAQSHDSGRE